MIPSALALATSYFEKFLESQSSKPGVLKLLLCWNLALGREIVSRHFSPSDSGNQASSYTVGTAMAARTAAGRR